ncbi:MAG: nuclear transport factor 2 family protein [Flavobacteriaceae bacterium]|nr:nuclear transport factor 2 family protein [Flavobacteriaceae bacterium]
MKKTIWILLLLAVTSGCSSTDKKAAMNIALIEQYVQAVEDLDYEVMASMLADNYIGHGPSVNDSIMKPEVIISWKDHVENLYESIDYNKSRNISVVIESGENKGEWVSNWAELEIVYKKDKKAVTIWTNTVYKVENGKIAKSLTFYNEADVLEQLGYVFINPNDL